MGIPISYILFGGFSMTVETVKQCALFMVVFSISLGVSIYIFYVLKDKTINIFGSDNLKEANKEFNEIVGQAPNKLKSMVKKND
jgi:hypothetical protein